MRNLLSFFLLLILAGCSPKVHPAGQPVAIEDLTTFRTGQPVTQATTGALRYKVSFNGDLTLTPLGVTTPTDTVVVPPGPIDPPIDPVTPPTPAADFFLGLNAHPWIDPAVTEPFKWLRYYLSSYYFWTGTGGKIKPQPMLQAGTPQAWGLDDILIKAKDKYNVLFTIHQTPTWLVNEGRGDGGGDNLPVLLGASRTDTNSYREYALMFSEITKRYGRIKYPDNQLNVDLSERWTGDGNVKKSGLNLLTYIQVWNEPNKWWKPVGKENATAEETAAMMSITYDYIKRADPSMQVVMPCLTDLHFPYVQAMEVWFTNNRKDKKWPCDIASFNHYGNSGNKLGQYPAQWHMSGGVGPLQDANFASIHPIVAFFKAKGIPVWITEMGFDTREPSPMFIQGGEVAQGPAIVETAEEYRKAGVKGVFAFTTANEPNPTAGGLYMNSGVLYEQSRGYAKKASFDVAAAYARTRQALPYLLYYPQPTGEPQLFPMSASRDKPVTVPKLSKPGKN